MKFKTLIFGLIFILFTISSNSEEKVYLCEGYTIKCPEDNGFNKKICKCIPKDLSLQNLEGVTVVEEKKSGLDFTNATPVTPEMLKEWAETARNIKGKKLFCKYSNDDLGAALEFKSLNKVKISGIDKDEEKIVIINGKYKALSDEVIINYKHKKIDEELIIDRKKLSIKYSSGSYCELLDDKVNVSDKLSATLNEIILRKSQGNKF